VVQSADYSGTLYPVQIIIPTLKSRIVYFRSSTDQLRWGMSIRKQIGLSKIQDFFTLDGQTIG
jgi:calcium-dependent protein kinase